jgi:hypothetical protein
MNRYNTPPVPPAPASQVSNSDQYLINNGYGYPSPSGKWIVVGLVAALFLVTISKSR